jgi:hypothetical protein
VICRLFEFCGTAFFGARRALVLGAAAELFCVALAVWAGVSLRVEMRPTLGPAAAIKALPREGVRRPVAVMALRPVLIPTLLSHRSRCFP